PERAEENARLGARDGRSAAPDRRHDRTRRTLVADAARSGRQATMNPIHDPFSVAGKSVIVTGGGTGIGAAIARVFSERGAKVLIASRNGEHLGPVAKALRDDGGTVESITCDVRDADQVETMFDRAESAFGGVDVMINNH